MAPTKLDNGMMTMLRGTLIKAVQFMMHVIHDKIGTSEFGSFEDLEVGVSTDDLTSSKCEILADNEVVYFVRFTEKFKNSNDARGARVLTFAMVMCTTKNPTCPMGCKYWETYAPSWQGSEEAVSRGTQEAITSLSNCLLRCTWSACKADAEEKANADMRDDLVKAATQMVNGDGTFRVDEVNED